MTASEPRTKPAVAPARVPATSLFVAADGMSAEPDLRAHSQRMRELRPGLHVHADDAHDAADFSARAEISEGLRIVLLLEGTVEVAYGRRAVRLSGRGVDGLPAGAERAERANALMVAVNEPDEFMRRAVRGRHARRVSLGLAPQWLAQCAAGLGAPQALHDFSSQHRARRGWRAPPRATALAEQMVNPPAMVPLLQNLYLESRALELIAEALGTLTGPQAAAQPTGLRPSEHRRMQELREFLETEAAWELSLDDIARHAGLNPTTLQQHFRALHGTTVFDWLRQHRLQRARLALERDGMTVGQAAMIAGYSSAANFATAYKRSFGLAPKLARARV